MLAEKASSKRKKVNPLHDCDATETPSLQSPLLIQLEFQRMILAAFSTEKPADARELDDLLLAHVVRPAVHGVAGENAIVTEFHTVGQHVVVAAAVVLDVGVGAHGCDPEEIRGWVVVWRSMSPSLWSCRLILSLWKVY